MKPEKDTTFALTEAQISTFYNELDAAARLLLGADRNVDDYYHIGTFIASAKASAYTLLENGGFIDFKAFSPYGKLDKYLIDTDSELLNLAKTIKNIIKKLEASIDNAGNKINKLRTTEFPPNIKKHTKDISELKYYIFAAVISCAAGIAGILRKEELVFKIISALGATGVVVFPSLAFYSRTIDISVPTTEIKRNEETTKITQELRDTLKDNLGLLNETLDKYVSNAKGKVFPLTEKLLNLCAGVVDDLEKTGTTQGRVYIEMQALGINLDAYNTDRMKELARVIDEDQTPLVDRINKFLLSLDKKLIEKYGNALYSDKGVSANDSAASAYKRELTHARKIAKRVQEEEAIASEGQKR